MKWIESENRVTIRSAPPRWIAYVFWIALVLLIGAIAFLAAGWLEGWSLIAYLVILIPLVIGLLSLRTLTIIPTIESTFERGAAGVQITYWMWLARAHTHRFPWSQIRGAGVQEVQMITHRAGYRMGLLVEGNLFYLMEFLPGAERETRNEIGQRLTDQFMMKGVLEVPPDFPARVDGRV